MPDEDSEPDRLVLLAGTANADLADAMAAELHTTLAARTVTRFPDSELRVSIEDTVRDADVFLVQPTTPPSDGHLLETLLLADAARRAGAARLTAVMPYVAYARQGRRAAGREPVGGRLVADLLRTAGFERVVAVDLHTPAVEGFFAMPVEHLSAVPLLARGVRADGHPPVDVVVAPDLGAVKLAERYAALLRLPMAVVPKMRLSGTEVKVRAVVGDVHGRRPLVIDDMISTGGTIEAAVRALLAAGCAPAVSVAATHGLLVGGAVDRLHALPIERLLVTDSVPIGHDLPLPVERVSLAPLLATVIRRLHRGESLADLFAH